MNTRISPLLLKQNTATDAKKVSLLQSGFQIMDTIFSVVLALFATIFFMWLNGKQHEFDELQDKPK